MSPGTAAAELKSQLPIPTLPGHVKLQQGKTQPNTSTMSTVKPLLKGPSRGQPPSHDRSVNLAFAGHLPCKLTSFERPLFCGV